MKNNTANTSSIKAKDTVKVSTKGQQLTKDGAIIEGRGIGG